MATSTVGGNVGTPVAPGNAGPDVADEGKDFNLKADRQAFGSHHDAGRRALVDGALKNEGKREEAVAGGLGKGIASLAASDAALAPGLKTLFQVLEAPATVADSMPREAISRDGIDALTSLLPMFGKAPAGGAIEAGFEVPNGGSLHFSLPSQALLATVAAAIRPEESALPLVQTWTALARTGVVGGRNEGGRNEGGRDEGGAAAVTGAGASVARNWSPRGAESKPDPEIVARVQFVQRLASLVQKSLAAKLDPGAFVALKQAVGNEPSGLLSPFAEQFPLIKTAVHEAVKGMTGERAATSERPELPPQALSTLENVLGKAWNKASGFAVDCKKHSKEIVEILQRHSDGDATAIKNAPPALRDLVLGAMSWNSRYGDGSFPTPSDADAGAVKVRFGAGGHQGPQGRPPHFGDEPIPHPVNPTPIFTPVYSSTVFKLPNIVPSPPNTPNPGPPNPSSPVTSSPDTSDLSASTGSITIGGDGGAAAGTVMGVDFGKLDPGALVTIIMQECSDEEADEMRDSMKEMQAHNLQKAAAREKAEQMQTDQANMQAEVNNTYYQYQAQGQIPSTVTLSQWQANAQINWGDGVTNADGSYTETPPVMQPPESWPSWQAMTAPPKSATSQPTAGANPFGLPTEQYNYLVSVYNALPADQQQLSVTAWLEAAPPQGVGLSAASDPSLVAGNLTAAAAWAKTNQPNGTPTSGPAPTSLGPLTPQQIEGDPSAKPPVPAMTAAQLTALLSGTGPSDLAKLTPDQLSAIMTVLMGSNPAEEGQLKQAYLEMSNDPGFAGVLKQLGLPVGAAASQLGTPPLTWGAIANAMVCCKNYQAAGDVMTGAGWSGIPNFSSSNDSLVVGWTNTIFTSILKDSPALGAVFGQLVQTQCQNEANNFKGYLNAQLANQHGQSVFPPTWYGPDPTKSVNDNDIMNGADLAWTLLEQTMGPVFQKAAKDGLGESGFQAVVGGTGGSTPFSNWIGGQLANIPTTPPGNNPANPAPAAPTEQDYTTAFGDTSYQAAVNQLLGNPVGTGSLPKNANGQYYDPAQATPPAPLSAAEESALQQLVADGIITLGPTPDQLTAQQQTQTQDTAAAAQAQGLGLNNSGNLSQYAAAVTAAKGTLDGLSDMDSEMQTEIQLESSQYTTLEQAISNMMKSFADMMTANVANLKS